MGSFSNEAVEVVNYVSKVTGLVPGRGRTETQVCLAPVRQVVGRQGEASEEALAPSCKDGDA